MPTTQIKDLKDAIAAIKDLQNFRREVTSQNWDLRQRRIINAHPSVGDYDYVVRKELKKFKAAGEESEEPLGEGGVSGIPNITFSVYGVVPEQTDLTPPALINAKGFILKPVLVYGRCLTPPTGDFKAELYHNNHPDKVKTSVLNSQFTILSGEFFATQNDINASVRFRHLDWMSLDTKVSIDTTDLEIVVAMDFA